MPKPAGNTCAPGVCASFGSFWERFCWLARCPLVYTTARFCNLARKSWWIRSASSKRSTFLYLTAVGKSGKGTSASQGNFRAEQDPFVARSLQRAFVTCLQSQQLQVVKFRSDPLALAPENRPAFVVAVPLQDVNRNFTGMLAAVVSLESILHRLQESSVRGRSVFLVDHNGRLVAHWDTKNFVPGADVSSNALVARVKALPQELRSTETVRFTE